MLQSAGQHQHRLTPNLITLDNEEAKIVVGENVPFITGQFTNTGTAGDAVNPFQTIERKDVGITLRIRPQIGEGGAVRMTIFQEHRSVKTASRPAPRNAGPSTTKRSIESTVVVDDGQILVLGGLIEDRYIDNTSKVPLLGDIPLRRRAVPQRKPRPSRRTNLMVFLRPIVMRDAEAANRSRSTATTRSAAQQQDAQPPPSVVLPINESPVLPPLPDGRSTATLPTRRPAADPARPAPRRPTAHAAAAAAAAPPTPPRNDRDGHPPPPALRLRQGQHAAAGRRRRAASCCGPARHAAAALSEVPRLFDVDALEREAAATLGQRIAAAYAGGETSAAAVIGEVESGVDLSRMMQDLPAVEDLLEAADDAPIIRMLNALLTQAAKDGASDIHIEPYERSSSVRFRVDGTLREVVQPNKALHAALISRLKIMAELDIAEKRLPQDGRISLRIGGRAIDVRVSTLPSAHGERAVLRLLDKSEAEVHARRPGHERRRARAVRQADPAAARHRARHRARPARARRRRCTRRSAALDTATTNVLTVEDPIEYELPGIGQTQVNPKIDLTFAKALRAILRQDPDVIMIGEIRDIETAQIAIQASLTGHLVLATVHTNDAPSTVTRLIDMGVEPFLLSSSLLGVLAQRLVRKLCAHCKRQDARGRWHPVGCAQCGSSGYKGRTGVYELMIADDKVRALIHSRAAESQLSWPPKPAGLRSMREDGERLVDEGITSLGRSHAGDARMMATRESPASAAPRLEAVSSHAAFRFEALDAAGKSSTGLLEADNAEGGARAVARPGAGAARSDAGRWRRADRARARASRGASSTPTTLAVWTRQLAGLVGAGLPLERALTALADESRRPAPARAGGAPEERGQRRQPVRTRAGQRAARVRRGLPRRRRRRRAERRARRRARAAGRRPGRAPGAEVQADRRHALPGHRLVDRDRDRDLPRDLRRAAGGLGVHAAPSARCRCSRWRCSRSAASCATGAGWSSLALAAGAGTLLADAAQRGVPAPLRRRLAHAAADRPAGARLQRGALCRHAGDAGRRPACRS